MGEVSAAPGSPLCPTGLPDGEVLLEAELTRTVLVRGGPLRLCGPWWI